MQLIANEVLGIDRLLINCIFAMIGAVIVVGYEVYRALPGIDAAMRLQRRSTPSQAVARTPAVWFQVVARYCVSICLAALICGFLVQPAEAVGAIITGMAWPVVVEKVLQGDVAKREVDHASI